MNTEKCTVLLLTCDKNADITEYCLAFLRKHWPQFEGPVFINTEEKRDLKSPYPCVYPDKVYVWDDPWSGRLYDCLEKIATPYVLIIMDDFFLTECVDDAEIGRCIGLMEENPDIACFNFAWSNSPFTRKEYERYVLVDRKATFRMNLQTALWNKKTLKKFIRKHENPWQFEIWGSKRVRRYADRVYHLDKGAKKVFTYPVGGAIADGKWRGDEVCQMMRQEGYNIDFEARGIYREGDARKTEIKHRTFLQKVWQVIKSLI